MTTSSNRISAWEQMLNRAEAERDEARAAIDAVVRAWNVPGPRPDIHRAAQDRLLREWPTLAHALARLAHEKETR